MDTLSLQLFGTFALQRDGQSLPATRTRKEQWLLALLVLRSPQALERAWLAATLWPDSADAQARGHLRHSLSNLRAVLGPDASRLVSETSRTLRFNVSGMQVDVLAFDAALARKEAAGLETAIAVYGGPLLERCEEAWVLPERQVREQGYGHALETLAETAQRSGDTRKAVSLLGRLLAVDPLRESAVRRLMQALADQGDQAALTKLYLDFRQLLHREMNADLSPETAALYRELQALRPTHAVVSASSAAPAPSSAAVSARGQLPHPLSRLIGREQEIETVQDCLASARLVTLIGVGGVGKTRLAIAAAEQVAGDYADGVRFVDLTPLSDPALIPQTIAAFFDLREEPGRSLTETLQDFLLPKSLLLVLDNCEHLVAGCASLAEALLLACPRLRVLATSREPLRIPGERLWRVPALSLPPPDLTFAEHKNALALLLDYEAPRLFVERAEWNNPDFRLTPPQADTVAQICAHLEGIPLAIELAAAQTRALSVEEIAGHLDDHLGLLQSGSRTLPRQETLRATLDWSYSLLSEEEQQLLQELSVFAGGCTLEAVEQVCGEDEEDESA